MKTLILNHDLKTIFIGSAFAVGLGLVVGAAMEPNLRGEGGPAGPQILVGQSGARTTPAENPYAVYAAYPETLPDYVIGSDWVKPPVPDGGIYPEAAMTGDEIAAYEVAAAPVAPAAPVAQTAPQVQDEAELAELAAATPG